MECTKCGDKAHRRIELSPRSKKYYAYRECKTCNRIWGKREVKKRIIWAAFDEEGNRIGGSHPKTRISDSTVEQMRDSYEHETNPKTITEIAKKTGVPFNTVKKICLYQRRISTTAEIRQVVIYE